MAHGGDVSLVGAASGCTAGVDLLGMRLRRRLVPLVLAVTVLSLHSEAGAAPRAATRTATAPVASTLPVGGLVFDGLRSGANLELHVADSASGTARRLTSDRSYDSWGGRLSPDRRRVVFHRTPAGVRDRDYRQASLWVVDVDGRNLRRLRAVGADGWQLQGHPEWTPDGRSLVVFGGQAHNPQIVVLGLDGRPTRLLTLRGGTNLDPSVSPDGRTVAFVGCPVAVCHPQDYEVYTVPLAGGPVTRLTFDGLRDHDPVFSPDGQRLAWLTKYSDAGAAGAWDIRVGAADGSGARRLLGDDHITSRPEWSRDGRRLLFHRLVYGRDTTFTLFSAKLDGTDLRPVRPGETSLAQYPST